MVQLKVKKTLVNLNVELKLSLNIDLNRDGRHSSPDSTPEFVISGGAACAVGG